MKMINTNVNYTQYHTGFWFRQICTEKFYDFFEITNLTNILTVVNELAKFDLNKLGFSDFKCILDTSNSYKECIHGSNFIASVKCYKEKNKQNQESKNNNNDDIEEFKNGMVRIGYVFNMIKILILFYYTKLKAKVF